jgi:hypothetical protein
VTLREVHIDCEFVPNDLSTKGLLSMGLVDDWGASLYVVNRDADWEQAARNDFIRQHVLPYLPVEYLDERWPERTRLIDSNPDVFSYSAIAKRVDEYFQQGDPAQTVLYAWYGAQDVVRLHQLWNSDWHGLMPSYIPKWHHDLRSMCDLYDIPVSDLPKQIGGSHHARADARHNMTIKRYIDGVLMGRKFIS